MDDILFYDIEGREIQKQSLQQLGYTDTTWLKYDFPGSLRKSQWSHMNNTTRTLISERFEYDHAGRLVETFHKIGTQAEQKISNQTYNERDELSQKQLAYSGGNYGQSIDYTYNIRKWLTQINDPASCGADLFSEKLGYTDANASLGATAKYNGNIAWIEWRTGANCTVGGLSRNKAGYGFIYDGLDRMTGSRYGENTGSWTNLNRYNENLTYDLNGNILTLGRRGYISAGNWNTIDTLAYTYGNSSNPNWATTIADGSGSALGYPNTSGTFSFDAAGNQTTYSAKSITAITYNHLNLPTKYTWSGGNTLEIQYDASGRKLAKVPSTGNSKTYVGSIEYSASAIEAIYHPEGRARLISSTWEYEYAVKDHLGNSRVYFKYNGSMSFLQENHYYPFGMEQGGWTVPSSPENKYKYNGKELNDDFSLGLYDYGARWYDPVVGRWTQIDPLAEMMPGWSPFNYGFNNPIRFVDPTGMAPDDWVKGADGTIRWDASANSQATTKQGETYLGKELTLTFNSFIDAKSWDGPNSKAPGDKLTSTITITGNEDSKGELTSLSGSKSVQIGSTPIGTARDYYPGEGGSNNNFELKSTASGATLNFEQHASVSKIEEIGLNALGFKVVDVAQKLNVDYNKKSGELSISAYTGLFPSATLSINGTQVMKYNQPSFVNTHSAPIVGNSSPSSGSIPIRNFSYYPSKLYKQ